LQFPADTTLAEWDSRLAPSGD